jgi:hypothetical protein
MCRCVMCRAEAHQLYARKPIFDAMGIQLVVCLNEHIDAEVCSLPHHFILPIIDRGSQCETGISLWGDFGQNWLRSSVLSPNSYMLVSWFSFIN